MRIIDNATWVPAIQAGVTAMHTAHAGRGWYDSHDLINWLSVQHNAVLNDIVINYNITGQGQPAKDPVHTATRETGKFIERWLGQVKIREHESARQITLTNGVQRDGVCVNSVWEITAATTSSAQRGVRSAGSRVPPPAAVRPSPPTPTMCIFERIKAARAKAQQQAAETARADAEPGSAADGGA